MYVMTEYSRAEVCLLGEEEGLGIVVSKLFGARVFL